MHKNRGNFRKYFNYFISGNIALSYLSGNSGSYKKLIKYLFQSYRKTQAKAVKFNDIWIFIKYESSQFNKYVSH